jgi:signal transduction histidine kinase
VAYPLVDVLLIAVAARLLMGPSRRERTQYLLLGFLIAILTSDVVYSLLALFGTYHTGDLVDAGWLLGYVLVGAAGLHPSMAALSRPQRDPDTRIRLRRLALLAAASLIAPAVLTIEWARGSPLDVPVVAACAGVLFLLVVSRMSGLVRDVASKADMLSAQGSELEQALTHLREVETERRKLLEETLRTGERERSRIAAELHDGSIQHLASLGYTLRRLGMRLDGGETEGAMELLEDAETMLGAEVSGLRAVMRGLRPPALDETGLVDAIRDHAASFADREQAECQVLLQPVPRLEPEIETALYRAAQEALRNVTRHAAATAVTVRLETRDDTVRLEIADNGRGFARDRIAGAVQRGHFGLAGMRERLEMAGGRLEIDSGPGAGTVVRAIVPLALLPAPSEPKRPAQDPTTAADGAAVARSEIGSLR